jgi:Ferritin-like domain
MSPRPRSPLAALDQSIDPSGSIEEAASTAFTLTRGELLRTTGAGLVLAGGAGASVASAAELRASDAAILNYALSLEYLQAAFYTEAEQRGALSGALAEQAHVVGGHERAHVAAVLGALGSAAIKRPSFDFHGVTESSKSFTETAVAFEDLAVAAYEEQAPRISSPAYLVAVVGIQSVEARHAAWIRRLAGVVPSINAFDEPASEARVKSLVASTNFVVNGARTSARGAPNFTG